MCVFGTDIQTELNLLGISLVKKIKQMNNKILKSYYLVWAPFTECNNGSQV